MPFQCLETTKFLSTLTAEQCYVLQHLVEPTDIDHLQAMLRSTSRIQNRWLEASMHVALLQDLFYNLIESSSAVEKPKNTPWWKKILFYFLTVAGSLYALSAGFDGITAFLALFTSIPIWGIVLAGLLCSILSIAVFHGFDLVTVSDNLQISVIESKHLLAVIADEIYWIKQIKQHLQVIKKYDLDAYHKTIQALFQCEIALKQDREIYKKTAIDPALQILKYIVACIIGLVFFSGGFFTGQSLALALLGLFCASISASFWPILLVSIAVGLAALSVYWFVERPELEKLVGRWFGRDPEKIELLQDDSDRYELQTMLSTFTVESSI